LAKRAKKNFTIFPQFIRDIPNVERIEIDHHNEFKDIWRVLIQGKKVDYLRQLRNIMPPEKRREKDERSYNAATVACCDSLEEVVVFIGDIKITKNLWIDHKLKDFMELKSCISDNIQMITTYLHLTQCSAAALC
jgi:hypothetical protein